MMETTLQNIPSPFKVHLRDCYKLGFADRPNYDALMEELYKGIEDEKFYLIENILDEDLDEKL